MKQDIITQRVGDTTYTVTLELMSNQLVVRAKTYIPARLEADLDCDFDGGSPAVLEHLIPSVDESWQVTVPYGVADEGDSLNRATDALAYGMNYLQPRVEENARRRAAGEPTLQEYERELRAMTNREKILREEAERVAREEKVAAAQREADRQQQELEELDCFGMF